MHNSKLIPVFILSLNVGFSTVSFTQTKVKQENQIQIVTELLKQCDSPDWQLQKYTFDGKPYSKGEPPGLFSRDQYFEKEYFATSNSKEYRRIIDSLDNSFIKLSAEIPEPTDSMEVITKKERELSIVDIYIYLNRPFIEGFPDKEIQAPGAALVTKSNNGFNTNDKWNSYFIAFGNWKAANYDSKKQSVSYQFKHNNKGQYIENAVVIMTGAEGRVKALMKNVNWQELNDIITE